MICFLTFITLSGHIFVFCDPSLFTEGLEKRLVSAVGVEKQIIVRECLYQYWEDFIDTKQNLFWILGGLLGCHGLLGCLGIILCLILFVSNDDYFFYYKREFDFRKRALFIVSFLVLNFFIILCISVFVIYFVAISHYDFFMFSETLETRLITSIGMDKQNVIETTLKNYWEHTAQSERLTYLFIYGLPMSVLFLSLIGLRDSLYLLFLFYKTEAVSASQIASALADLPLKTHDNQTIK
jgi:hypothetical protein